jgi:PadR family transcriptional regulator, regulatory protein PadR
MTKRRVTKTKPQGRVEIEDKDIHWGLIRIYILHRAAIEPIFSLGIVERLDRHGLKLSTGYVSQILRGLEGKGYLVSTSVADGPQSHKMYRTTGRGRLAIKKARNKVRDLFAKLS